MSFTSQSKAQPFDIYTRIISQLPFLSFPYILDYLKIFGLSNASVVVAIVDKLVTYRSSYKNELISSINETAEVVKLIIDSNQRQLKSTKSKQSLTVDMSVEDKIAFIEDIVCTLFIFIHISKESKTSSKYHPLSALFCGNLTGLSLIGVKLLNSLKDIYEVILPSLDYDSHHPFSITRKLLLLVRL